MAARGGINIQFQEHDKPEVRLEKLRRLATAIDDLARNISRQSNSGSSSSTTTTALNVGTGVGVYKDSSGTQLNFRTILAGTGITVTLDGDDIVIDADPPEQQLEPLLITGAF